MILKALEIHGFKSFPDKTTLTFGGGMTAVVGPNGSGKSNISDAIRWVLGEQSNKALRSGKSEDVIFNGTAQRKGVGFAEVSLIIDNTGRLLDFDADDVKVTRRYFRSGESEYLINNVKVRLEDIRLLFMDTGLGRDGYSIIGQGRIGDIVASKSEERREMFEEAAGIAKYRHRKTKAERQLAGAEDNLLRLRDILKELEERVGPLEQQSKKAKKYLEIYDEKKDLEIGVWLYTLRTSQETLRDLLSKLELSRTQYDKAGQRREEREEACEQLAQTMQRLMVEMDEARREGQRLEEEAVGRETAAGLLKNDAAHALETVARIERELLASQQGREAMQIAIDARLREIGEKQRDVDTQEKERAALEQQLQELSRTQMAASDRFEALTGEAAVVSLKLSDIRVRTVTAENALTEMDEQQSQLQEALRNRRKQREESEALLAKGESDYAALSEQVVELQNAVKGYEFRVSTRAQKLEAAKRELEKLSLDTGEKTRRIQLLEEMERNLDGFAQSVKTIVRQGQRGALPGIHGPVSRLLQVDAAYALAVETALGGAGQNIVCDREEDAKQAIAYLKQTNGGRVTFFPLTTIKGSPLRENGLEKQPGFVGLASSLLSCDPRYTGVADHLLGRTAVVKTLDDAVRLAKVYQYRFRVVTLDGQVVNAGGSMTGGSSVKGAGMLSRRAEIERLQKELSALSAQRDEVDARVKQLQQEQAEATAQLTGAGGELAHAQEERIRLEAEQRRLKELAQAHRQEEEEYIRQGEERERRAEEYRLSLQKAREEMTVALSQKETLDQQIQELSDNRQTQTAALEQLSADIGDRRLRIVGLMKDIEALQAAVDEQRQLQNSEEEVRRQRLQEIDQLKEQSEQLQHQASQRLDEAAQLRQQAEQALDRIEALKRQRQAEEAQTVTLRQQAREAMEEREQAAGEIARLEEKCAAARRQAEDIERRLFEEYELTKGEAEEMVQPPADMAAASRRLNELKNKMKALGSVNLASIEEYKEVSERYGFLQGQVKDLELSRDELRRLIGELTAQMKELFLEKFQVINEQFGAVFVELFGGGRAQLQLTDPADVLNTGIEMYVQPPGKVILNLDALSGGEKALVAIALLFAILKVAPSPFCVLDEIEAALDDVNVDRYAAYLRRMSVHTQFIVITHRRGTMEEADLLYGVTMQERGVSKLLELRASEVEAKLGISGAKMDG